MVNHFRRWVSKSAAIALTVLCCCSAPASAQSYVARANGTDRFAVVLSPDVSSTLLSITLAPIGGDECGRDFYFRGVLQPDASRLRGAVTGTMKRCTTRELEDKCRALGRPIGENYTKPVIGTFNNESYGMSLQLNYVAEKWNKNECKLEKSENGSDVVVIASAEGSGSTSRVNYGELFREAFWKAAGPR